jgi:hypothetical protein
MLSFYSDKHQKTAAHAWNGLPRKVPEAALSSRTAADYSAISPELFSKSAVGDNGGQVQSHGLNMQVHGERESQQGWCAGVTQL